MTISHRISIAAIALLAAVGVTFGAAWVGYQSANADDSYVLAFVEGSGELRDAGVSSTSGDTFIVAGTLPDAPSSAQPSAPATSGPTTLSVPRASDIDVATKLWRAGDFFGLGILVLYVGLFAGLKLDKKRAFYYATAMGGLGLVFESIRGGDTPTLAMIMTPAITTLGILLVGPNHARTPTPPSP